MRCAKILRRTAETDIALTIELDGRGQSEISTGIGFLDHMLTLLAKHGRFDLTVTCRGDTNVDDHHSAEDIGICLGSAFAQALGERRGVLTAVDLSGRGVLGWDLPIPTEKIGTFDTELVKEFWLAFVREAKCAFHFRLLAGENSHHIAEGAFKSAARSLRQAVSIDAACADEIPSTRGVL